VVTLDYQACGVLLAECGDHERYNQFCRAAIERFRSSNNGDMMGRILKTCLLFPPEESMMQELAPMALVVDRYFSSTPKETFPIWSIIHVALWEYRRGNYAAADDWCRRGIDRSAHVLSLNVTLSIIQAMADQQRGQTEAAARELAPARKTVERRFESGPLQGDQQGSWYDWVFARILLREAAAAIEPVPYSENR
jgi:eukaryotic-like serine/threonine-protein kinase